MLESYDFDAYVGTTISFSIIARDENEVAIDLTGYSVYAHVRLDYGGALALDLAPGITDAVAGEITIDVVVSGNMEPKAYKYDVLLVDGDGVITKILFGTITILPTITVIP